MSSILPIGPAARVAGPYTATEGQTSFPYAFALIDPADLLVETAPASAPDSWSPATLDLHYTLSPAPPVSAGGNVVFLTGRGAGGRVRISGAAVIANTQDPLPGGMVDSVRLNRFFDRVTIWAQEARTGVLGLLGYINALDAQNVKLTGNQTVSGTKTFLDARVSAPLYAASPATKEYVDQKALDAGDGLHPATLEEVVEGVSNAVGVTPLGLAISIPGIVSRTAVPAVDLSGVPAVIVERWSDTSHAAPARYVNRGATEPSHTAKFQAGAIWFEMDEPRPNVLMFGAMGDWDGSAGTDDAPAFQRGIDYLAARGAGTLDVPPVDVAYRWNQQVHLKRNLSLLGASFLPKPNTYAEYLADLYGGYCIAITWGAGSAGVYDTPTAHALRVSPGTTVAGLRFIYPGQVDSPLASAPVVFPPTIGAYDYDAPGGSFENLFFCNSYKAVYLPGSHDQVRFKSVWGQILAEFITVGGAFGGDQFEDVNASGIFYLQRHPDQGFGAALNTGLWAWVQRHGVAFRVGYADAIRWTHCFIGNCRDGLQFGYTDRPPSTVSLRQLAYGHWIGGGIEGVSFPIRVSAGPDGTNGLNANGFHVVGAGIAPVALYDDTRAVSVVFEMPNAAQPPGAGYRGKLTFNSCGFWGSGDWQDNVGPLEGVLDTLGGDIEFIACTFNLQQSYVARVGGAASVKFVGCTFVDEAGLTPSYYHFVVSGSAAASIVYDETCEFRKPLHVLSGSAAAYIEGYTVPSIASAAAITLPKRGKLFTITGTTNIGDISVRPAGSHITLRFASGLTVFNSGNIKLAANTAFAANATLSLISDGTNWWPA